MLTILHPLDLSHRVGPRRRDHRAVGQRQVDAARAACRPRRATDRPHPHRRVRHHRDVARTRWRGFAARESAFVFQFFHLLPSLTAWENVRVPLEIAGAAAPGARADALLAEVGLAGRGASLSVAALRRRAAARRHRPRAGQRSGDPARRRADRQSRHRHRAAGHRPADRRQPPPRRRRSCSSPTTPSWHAARISQSRCATAASHERAGS